MGHKSNNRVHHKNERDKISLHSSGFLQPLTVPVNRVHGGKVPVEGKCA